MYIICDLNIKIYRKICIWNAIYIVFGKIKIVFLKLNKTMAATKKKDAHQKSVQEPVVSNIFEKSITDIHAV